MQDIFDEVKEEEPLKDIENFSYTTMIRLIMIKFLKAIGNILWALLIEILLLLIQKSLWKIWRQQKWNLLILPSNKKLKKGQISIDNDEKQDEVGNENCCNEKG